MQHMKI